MRRLAAAAIALAMFESHAQDAVVFAAGSLRAPLGAAASAFEARGRGGVRLEFGPSGMLRERLANGEKADIFAPANMEHPRAIAAQGRAGPVRAFARNRLCVLARHELAVTTANLLDRMLDPAVRLATSTPKLDPAGDYAWTVFERAEKRRRGAFDALSTKALQLVGGRDATAPSRGRSIYGELVAQGKSDLFLTYCSNAMQAAREEPGLVVTDLPPELSVGAEYGLVVMNGASATGKAFAEYLLSADGRRFLAEAGFAP